MLDIPAVGGASGAGGIHSNSPKNHNLDLGDGVPDGLEKEEAESPRRERGRC